MLKGQPVALPAALDRARALLAAARHPVALVSSWASNEELQRFQQTLGARLVGFVKPDHQPLPGEVLEDDVLIQPDKNPNTRAALALFPALPANPRAAFSADTDLVLVWGEGFSFVDLPPQAAIVYLNAWLQPENGHADVFLPISVQTERSGHYTNCQGTVSDFQACFAKPPGVVDAEDLFAALALQAQAPAEVNTR
jgi:NADH-quinone oxidoreductase subunit G